jgi:hypothetical protein
MKIKYISRLDSFPRRPPKVKPPPPAQYECGRPCKSRGDRFLKHTVSRVIIANKNETQRTKGDLLC